MLFMAHRGFIEAPLLTRTWLLAKGYTGPRAHTYIHMRTHTHPHTYILQNKTVRDKLQFFRYVGFSTYYLLKSLLVLMKGVELKRKACPISRRIRPSTWRPLLRPCIRKWQEGRASFGCFPLLIRWRFGAQRRPGTLTGKKANYCS